MIRRCAWILAVFLACTAAAAAAVVKVKATATADQATELTVELEVSIDGVPSPGPGPEPEPGPDPDPDPGPAPAPVGVVHGDLPHPLFPASSEWYRDVSADPVDPRSAEYLARINWQEYGKPANTAPWNTLAWLHPVMGGDGIPYLVVQNAPEVPVDLGRWAAESDPGPYHVPLSAPIEAGNDKHVICYDAGRKRLYEFFNANRATAGRWGATSAAIWDVTKGDDQRTAGWTSADAAGLAILPGLVRLKEAETGMISHAIRITVPKTRKAYLPPARHWASSDTTENYLPMGARLRIKAGVDESKFGASEKVRAIIRAGKKYGFIVADNGLPFGVCGTAEAFDAEEMGTIKKVRGQALWDSLEVLAIDPAKLAVPKP